MPIGSSLGPRRPFLLGALAACLALATSTSVLAQGVSVQVEPSTVEGDAATLTATGAGFSTAGNGVYVVFGPVTAAPAYYMDPGLYASFKWVAPGGSDTPATAPLAEDGSFATTLDVTSTFTTSAGDVDCTVSACAVITFAAHGSPDRSQDTCTLVTFAAAALASPVAGASPIASPVVPAPSASVMPDGSAAPVTAGDCSLIGAPAP